MLNAHLLLATMDFAAPEPPFHKQTMQHSAKAYSSFYYHLKMFSLSFAKRIIDSQQFFLLCVDDSIVYSVFLCVCVHVANNIR